MKSLIIIPYANLDHMQGGVNIAAKGRFDTYMQNCCVSLLSAKTANPDADVALVTNIDVPDPYKTLLEQAAIGIIHAPFDSFRFSADYRWGLAFYKLCALKYVAENLEYDNYAYLDSDVYIQSSFDPIWTECRDNILLYDINHGLQVQDYRNILKDFKAFLQTDQIITHYGGEFFAANRENALAFIREAYTVFLKMDQTGFQTTAGDEFILSVVAHHNKNLVRNAGAYIFRFWTDSFYLVCNCYRYNPVAILHVPDEKRYGMLRLYRFYLRHKRFPRLPKVWRILNISRQTLPRKMMILAKTVAKKILKR